MTLLEVLTAFLILSLSFLGLDAALLYSLHQSKSIYYVSVAKQQLNNLIERISVLEAQPLSVEQLNQWDQQNHELLPSGRGALTYDYPNGVISVFWGKANGQVCKHNQIGQSGCLRATIEIAS